MEINLTTPALLFPAISLLMLAFTNRFLALASLIRNLYSQYQTTRDTRLLGQIDNLRRRIFLIRNMQALGVGSILLCTICMFVLFVGQLLLGKVLFAASLITLMAALSLSLREIAISINALDLQLRDMECDLADSKQ